MVFPIVMYGCESWTIKKAEHQRIDAFELWCWKRLLRVPWTARRANQSILKKISPEYSLERLMLKRKLPILWPPNAKNWLTGKDPDVGKDGRQEEKGMTEDEMVGWHHQLSGHEFEWTPGVGDGQKSLACCSPWGLKESETNEQLNWTELKDNLIGRWKQMSIKMRPSVFSQVFIFFVKAKSKRGRQGSLFNFCSSLHPLVLKCLITCYPSKLFAFSQFPWCCPLALSSAQMTSSSHKIFLIFFVSFPEWRKKKFFYTPH